MRISGPGPIRPAEVRRQITPRKPREQRFSVTSESDEPSNAPVTASSTVASVDALLALQEIDRDVDDRRRATHRGHVLLDRLDHIRHALLIGAIPRRELSSLAEMARQQRPEVSDPRLGEVLDEIELRVAVELAKLDRTT